MNDKIRVIIQDEGYSRGFGVYGGSLIDADLTRTGSGVGGSGGGVGRDNFGELFPAFFLEALEPSEVPDPNTKLGKTPKRLAAIEVENDGSDGEAAVIVVRGVGLTFSPSPSSSTRRCSARTETFPRCFLRPATSSIPA